MSEQVNELPVEDDTDEQRRLAALSAARGINYANIGDYLIAAKQVEDYLKDGNLPTQSE